MNSHRTSGDRDKHRKKAKDTSPVTPAKRGNATDTSSKDKDQKKTCTWTGNDRDTDRREKSTA